MKQKCSLSFLITALLFSNMVFSQDNKSIKEYLHVPGPVIFDNVSYTLSWTSHPTANYYKQEYIVKGDNSEKFKSMIMIELVTGNVNIKDIVSAKVEELKKMKATNPIVNYELITNAATGEYMIDFLLSQNNEGTRRAEIVERNIYRYKTYTGKGGQSGIILFAISSRSYGNDVDPFLASLKSTRKDLLNKMSKYSIPVITL